MRQLRGKPLDQASRELGVHPEVGVTDEAIRKAMGCAVDVPFRLL
jgi:hypothetical protein